MRKRVFLGALIDGNAGFEPVECQVRSLSDSGARLSPATAFDPSSSFRMRLSGQARMRRAEVVWRRGNDIGVKFAAEAPAAPVSGGSANDNGGDSVLALRKRFAFVEN